MIDLWQTIRSMIAPELERFRVRYPRSRRREILETMHVAAVAEDTGGLAAAGADYFAFTSVVPPGCYAECPQREAKYFLAGERISGRMPGEQWSIHPYNHQVWR